MAYVIAVRRWTRVQRRPATHAVVSGEDKTVCGMRDISDMKVQPARYGPPSCGRCQLRLMIEDDPKDGWLRLTGARKG